MASRRARSEFATEAEWGRAVREWLGTECALCGEMRGTQADHIIPRAQQGRNDLHNGWVICGIIGCRFHLRLTHNLAKIPIDRLQPEHLAYLAENKYLMIDGQELSGLGWRRFRV